MLPEPEKTTVPPAHVAPTPPAVEMMTEAELLATVKQLNRHARRAFSSMTRHYVPLRVAFLRVTGFEPLKLAVHKNAAPATPAAFGGGWVL
jgi:hypothetical protein